MYIRNGLRVYPGGVNGLGLGALDIYPQGLGVPMLLNPTTVTDVLPDIPGIDEDAEWTIFGVDVNAQDYVKAGLVGAVVGSLLSKKGGMGLGFGLGLTLSWLASRE